MLVQHSRFFNVYFCREDCRNIIHHFDDRARSGQKPLASIGWKNYWPTAAAEFARIHRDPRGLRSPESASEGPERSAGSHGPYHPIILPNKSSSSVPIPNCCCAGIPRVPGLMGRAATAVAWKGKLFLLPMICGCQAHRATAGNCIHRQLQAVALYYAGGGMQLLRGGGGMQFLYRGWCTTLGYVYLTVCSQEVTCITKRYIFC